jgi:hypothetical protein
MVVEFSERFGEGLEQFAQPIELFTPYPGNPRKHDLPKIMASLAKYGQQSPLTVQRSTGYVCKGNGTLEAAKRLGWKRIAAREEDFDNDTALQYLYADNKASDLAEYDAAKTAAGLRKLVEGPGLADTLWTVDELEDLEFGLQGAAETIAEEFKGGYADAGEEGTAREASGQRSGEKMKEVPLVLSLADHAEFIGNVKKLREIYGTTGTIATIVEAVKRQAEGALPAQEVAEAHREAVEDLILLFESRAGDYMTGQQAADFIRKSYNAEDDGKPRIEAATVPGQMAAFPELESDGA